MRVAAALLALLLSAPAMAAPGGALGSVRIGDYHCELPGDAAGPSRRPVPEENFSVLNASIYRTTQGTGSYLLTGDLLTMTSGPKRGQKFRRLGSNFLRKLDGDGNETRLRCVRRTLNSG